MKLFSVQYLRGLAALLVMVTHAVAHPLETQAPATLRMGAAGVTLFFVISGFIMVHMSSTGPFDRLDFYRRRVERIVPLYWLATLALAIVAIIAPTLLKGTQFDWRSLILSLFFIPHYRGNGELVPLLKLGWTLNLEMFFYLMFGLCARLHSTQRVLVLTLLFGGLALLGQMAAFHNPLLAAYTAPHLLSFCIGMWTALWLERVDAGARVPTSAQMLATIGGATLAISLIVPNGVPLAMVLVMQALASALLIAGGVRGERGLRRSPTATLMGDASYSIYLVHMYPVAMIVVLWRKFAPDLPALAIVPVCLIAGVFGGLIVHYVAERPIMNWFTRRRRAAAAAKPDAPTVGVVVQQS